MSTFLQLCRTLAQECEITQLSTVPSAVTSQTGDLLRVVNWTAQAYTELQNRHANWRWLRCGFTVNTVANDDTYAYGDCTDAKASAAISRFASWWAHDRRNPFKCYLTSGGVSGQYWLRWLPYEDWKSVYKFGSQQSQTAQPIHVSVDDDNQIVLGPKPDAIYTVTGDFQRSAQILAADADTPEMPARFHQLIVYRAMEKYAGLKSASEIMMRAKNEGRPMLRALEADQLPMIRMAAPLA